MAIHMTYDLTIDQLPRECIEECSAGGRDAAPFVSQWREDLGFTVDRARAISCLAGYGAWSREELAANTDDDLADKVLWLACGDFAGLIVDAEYLGIDPFGKLPDDFEPSSGSDIFTLD